MSSGGRLEGKSYRSSEIILKDGRGLEMPVGKLGGIRRANQQAAGEEAETGQGLEEARLRRGQGTAS